MGRLIRSGLLVPVFFLLAPMALAHHSVAGNFDMTRTSEAEGEIASVAWRNPHILFTLNSLDPGQPAQQWVLQANSISVVSRLGLTKSLFKVGEHVKVFGNVGRRDDHTLWVTNMLLPSGEEVLLDAKAEPRWSKHTIGAPVQADVTPDPTGKLGIFRVWTSVGGGGALWNSSYPLTPAAAAARAAWDPVEDAPTKNCAPKGMPLMMEQPYPMEFVDQGDVILMRLEEYDATRTIAMTPEAAARTSQAPRLGRSVGRWNGPRTLVVDTTDIDYDWFDKTGIRQSPAVRTEERFTLSADGSTLDYELTVTDPATFTEPVVLRKSWAWRPGEVIRPYHCEP